MSNFNFKKKFGQNFLKDDSIVKKIVNLSSIEKNSLTLEVGPGKAILTKKLSNASDNVLCYEIDLDLKEYLLNIFENSNVDIIFDDFLNRDIRKDVDKYEYKNLYFISNVPYYITTPILIKLIKSGLNFEKIVMMVQEEVGERFSAKVNSKSYGSITVYLNYYFNIKREFRVDRNEFIPVPNVDSEIISLTKKEKLLHLNNEEKFFKLVKDSFKFKRKTIKNNLRDYDLVIIEKVLKENNLDLNSRAEQIPMEVFVEMSNSLNFE